MDREKSRAKKFIKKVASQVEQLGNSTSMSDIIILNTFQTVVSQLPQGNPIKKSIESDLETFFELFAATA